MVEVMSRGCDRPGSIPVSELFPPARPLVLTLLHAAGMREGEIMRFTKAVAAMLSATACVALAADVPVTYGPAVVVTATRFEERPDALPVGVTVLRAEDLQRSAARSLPELLTQFAGIHIRDNTGGPDYQVDMRGFGITGDQNTLVLINGQRLSEIELISVGWSTIPLTAIERVEIMRGSGSVLYGGGATGGTINIITRAPRPGGKAAQLFGGIGSYDTHEVRGAATIAGERVGIALSGNQLESDNYRVNNRVRQRNGEADLRFGDSARNFSIKFGSDEQDLRNPGVRTAAQLVTDRRGATTPADFSSRSGSRLNFGANWKLGRNELAANLTYRDREAKANQQFFGVDNSVTTQVSTWAFSPRMRIPFDLGGRPNALVIGVDVDYWDYDSIFTGIFNSHALATQRNQALYFQDNLEVTRDTRLTVGARVLRTENSITELLPVTTMTDHSRSPRAYEIALRHRLNSSLTVFASIGRSFRIATVDENRFQVTLLEPQTSSDVGAGVEYQIGSLRLRAAPYQYDLKNEISFLPGPVFPPFGANINLPPTRRRGMELETAFELGENIDLFANYTLVEAKFRSGMFGGADVTGKDVPLVPKNSLSLGGSWKIAGKTRISGVLKYVGDQRLDNDQANTFRQSMPAYKTTDLKLTHETRGWLLSAGIKNLLNEKYFSYGIVNAAGTSFNAYPAPERALFVSAQYSLR